MINTLKPTIKSEIFSWVLIIIAGVSSVYFYQHFPARVISHWNFAGQPDGWSGRGVGAFSIPAVLLGIYFLFLVIPYLDPRKERYVEFVKPYNIFRNIILLIMTIVYFVASLNNIGFNLDVGAWISSVIGILFIVLGNYLGKIKPNWFVGIRTPWTLSSEVVWNKTHRFGGKVFVVSGIILILTNLSPLSWRLPLLIINITILLFGTIIYSYIAYLAEKKK
jgi:uncharacterized membrane protein